MEPAAQALHAAAPWIMSWDDHETANNAYMDGAENHNPDQGEGPWAERRDAALRAWYDWTPSREPEDLRDRYGVYEIGNLATICLIESRLSARDQEVSLDSFPVASDADAEDPAALSARAKELAAADDHDEATELYSKALELQCAPREPCVRATP